MSTTSALFAVISVAVATYFFRACVIVLFAKRPLPGIVERALRYVGPAVLASMTTSLAVGTGEEAPKLVASQLIAIAVGGLITYLKANMTWGMAAGMVVLWTLSALGI